MKKINYKETSFEKMAISIDGDEIVGLFSDDRIDENTIPQDKFIYCIRHGDSGEPASLEHSVLVDFYGSLIVSKDKGFKWFTKHAKKTIDFEFVDLESDNVEIWYPEV